MEEKRPSQFKRARENAGLSLSQAARVMGVDLRMLAHIENLDMSAPVYVQTAMEEAYQVSYAYLLTGKPYTLIDHMADGTPEDVIKAMLKDGKFLETN